jgi:16S rRNA (adenine1518-N6/adenine1519-N6)-dimethyltransferase
MLKIVKAELSKVSLGPNRRLGQNFLIAPGIIKKILETAQLTPLDIILEIGPGLGALTIEIAKKVKKVLAIEKDPKMCALLANTLRSGNINNAELAHADILNFQFPIFNFQTYKVVANLPFYITNPVIMKFLEDKHPPEIMVLMVQKEVAQRICAKPPKSNKLAVFCQFYSQPKIISYVSKNSFWPAPKVDCAIIRFSAIDAKMPALNKKIFSQVVNAGFSQPRKQLINNFCKALELPRQQVETWLLKNNIKSSQRAQTLTVAQWISLTASQPMKK